MYPVELHDTAAMVITMQGSLLLFFWIRLPPRLLPVLGPLERYMTPTLDAALLISSRAGASNHNYDCMGAKFLLAAVDSL